MSDHLSRYDFVVHVRYRKFSGSSNMSDGCGTGIFLAIRGGKEGDLRRLVMTAGCSTIGH